MSEEKKFMFPNQFTVRLSDEELEYIDENYEDLMQTTSKVSPNKIFMRALSQAVSNIKPQIKEVSKSEDLQRIETLKAEIEQKEKMLNEAAEFVNERDQKIAALEELAKKPAGLCFNLDQKSLEYIEAIILISMRDKWAESPEDWLIKVIKSYQADYKHFILDEEDIKYYKSLKTKHNE
jgi:hypothetical protein